MNIHTFPYNLRRLVILTGGFGSGKSELSINLALAWRQVKPVSLVDLDVVNPYFRSREARRFLTEQDINLVAPREEWMNADLPILSPGIRGLVRESAAQVILDVGGDEIGAVALGGFQADVRRVDHDMLLVVNPYRPFTSEPAAIRKMAREIEQASRLTITGLISNPNLALATDRDAVLQGHDVVLAAAREMNLPVLALAALADLVKQLPQVSVPVFPIKIHLLPEWLIQRK